jgi:hypothetical protein
MATTDESAPKIPMTSSFFDINIEATLDQFRGVVESLGKRQ